jgi:threonine/homoserine/homoserine lactone efflux protein
MIRGVEGLPIWGYLAVTVPLVLTPGASTAVVLRNSIAGGTRAGVETAVGINAGSFGYGLLSAFGLALALRRVPAVWEVLRAGGAVYLAWLGVQSLRRAWSSAPAFADRGTTRASRGRFAHVYEGFLTNALNPAIATFYLLILPQFIPRDAAPVRSALVLTAVHIALAATWHVAWAAAGGTLSRVLATGRARRVLEASAGTALLILAVTLLF